MVIFKVKVLQKILIILSSCKANNESAKVNARDQKREEFGI